uniref:PH01B035L11.19 protein n=1 Tax=Phyllostachys edulis TaxID=38705 RepID=L0P1Q3_PHYED|nr:PH01B035L11.19 [Phyllostachys edulis]
MRKKVKMQGCPSLNSQSCWEFQGTCEYKTPASASPGNSSEISAAIKGKKEVSEADRWGQSTLGVGDFCKEFGDMTSREFQISMIRELSHFLGLQIKQLKDGTFVSQTKYAKDLIKKFGIEDAKPIKTPMATNGHLDLNEGVWKCGSTAVVSAVRLQYSAAVVSAMPRTRGTTRKSVGAGRGQSSSSRPSAASVQAEEASEVRQKAVQDRGKGPAIVELENEEDSSQAESKTESNTSEDLAGSDEEMGEPEEPQDDLRMISADQFAIKRHINQYLFSSNSINPRFHIKFQEQVYDQLYGPHRKFADHKWIKNNYDEENIRQFYATVHVSPDLSTMKWMTVTRCVECTKEDFERVLRTPSGTWDKLYDNPALLAPTWTNFYDLDVKYTPGKIHGLKPIPSLINRIINHTFFPKSGNFDAVRGHVWNIIDNIMNGRKFDVVEVILRGIVNSKNNRVKRIYHAPYIMALILSKFEYHGGLGSPYKPYKPREGPPIQRGEQEEDAPEEAAAGGAQDQEMRTAQLEFQNETHNRLAALSESVDAMEKLLATPQRYTRCPPLPRASSTPAGPSLASATAPLAPADPAPVPQASAPQDLAPLPPQDPAV